MAAARDVCRAEAGVAEALLAFDTIRVEAKAAYGTVFGCDRVVASLANVRLGKVELLPRRARHVDVGQGWKRLARVEEPAAR